jgi:hypothetical protein
MQVYCVLWGDEFTCSDGLKEIYTSHELATQRAAQLNIDDGGEHYYVGAYEVHTRLQTN